MGINKLFGNNPSGVSTVAPESEKISNNTAKGAENKQDVKEARNQAEKASEALKNMQPEQTSHQKTLHGQAPVSDIPDAAPVGEYKEPSMEELFKGMDGLGGLMEAIADARNLKTSDEGES